MEDEHDMKLGVIFPQTEIGSDPAVIRDYAQASESAGYDHLLVFDHVLGGTPERFDKLGRRPPYTDQSPFHEVFVLFGYLGACTRRLELVTGIAQAGIDALIELAGGKQPRGRPVGLLCDNPQVQDAVGRADAILNAGRAYRTAMIAELWNTVAGGAETTLEQRARCRLASTYAGQSARAAMDLVYHLGGSTSFKRESRLAECWRDLHTVGQTVTLAPEWYPIGGRVYLGIDPGPRLR